MAPLIPVLRDFGMTAETGFLPAEVPPATLLNPYYEKWETILANLPAIIGDHRIRVVVDELPVLSTAHLRTCAEWRRAYVLLAFMSHAYIWGGTIPSEPTTPAESTDHLEEMTTLVTFTGTADEKWFYLISVAIERAGAPVIPLMLEAIVAHYAGDLSTVATALHTFTKILDRITAILLRMYERCRPYVFYNHIRRFIAGSKNMAGAGLPNGVIYDIGLGSEEYRQYGGGSNAQSSLFHFFDIVLGVEHHPTDTTRPRDNFVHEMRSYMPGPHHRFLEDVSKIANIHEFLTSCRSDGRLSAPYSACVSALANLRNKHIHLVTRYIVIQSHKSRTLLGAERLLTSQTTSGTIIRSISPNNNPENEGLHGTAGSSMMPF
ncbi:Indoleamine 2,3-dioxygenase [Penicillium subrubescens]|uniref:Indoleamine 2,3-dioxygenase n=1 Tax=Penicillium subrubescens TaxID=1316194 RepID=A0A1Q5TEL3_9EURO|nr:Indoleamine 2,3-dioxygenase [Penicillium subrubescens]